MSLNIKKLLPLIFACCLLVGCSSIYYGTMEKVGYHKRDLLKKRVVKARAEQQQTKEEFASALEEFQSVVNVANSKLSNQYETIEEIYQRTSAQAKALNSRVDDVEDVALALFKEWQKELKSYQNKTLRTKSQSQLSDTKAKYQTLIKAMRNAEDSLDPVLTVLNDNRLYLKHNLNAAAISALRSEKVKVEQQVGEIIRRVNQAIAESERFIAELE